MSAKNAKQTKAPAKSIAAVSGKTKAAKAVKAILSPEVKAARDAMLPALLALAQAKADNKETGESTNGTVYAALTTLRNTVSGKVYATAVDTLFGNGSQSKVPGVRTLGILREAIPEERRFSMAATMSKARKVAAWIVDAQHFQKFQTAGTLVGALKVCTVKATPPATHPEREAGPAVDVTPPTIEQMIAKFGLSPTFKALANILAVDKATKLLAQTCEGLAKATA